MKFKKEKLSNHFLPQGLKSLTTSCLTQQQKSCSVMNRVNSNWKRKASSTEYYSYAKDCLRVCSICLCPDVPRIIWIRWFRWILYFHLQRDVALDPLTNLLCLSCLPHSATIQKWDAYVWCCGGSSPLLHYPIRLFVTDYDIQWLSGLIEDRTSANCAHFCWFKIFFSKWPLNAQPLLFTKYEANPAIRL